MAWSVTNGILGTLLSYRFKYFIWLSQKYTLLLQHCTGQNMQCGMEIIMVLVYVNRYIFHENMHQLFSLFRSGDLDL